jgi:hypothetical protein
MDSKLETTLVRQLLMMSGEWIVRRSQRGTGKVLERLVTLSGALQRRADGDP